jgi:hypothetical protein
VTEFMTVSTAGWHGAHVVCILPLPLMRICMKPAGWAIPFTRVQPLGPTALFKGPDCTAEGVLAEGVLAEGALAAGALADDGADGEGVIVTDEPHAASNTARVATSAARPGLVPAVRRAAAGRPSPWTVARVPDGGRHDIVRSTSTSTVVRPARW